MPWYRSGTVSINSGSTSVVGVATDFSANSRVGDAFQGPDGRWYEVTNIASSTVLAIFPAYQGANISGGSYGLAPMQGYVKESADSLRSLVNQFGAKMAALGTTGNYETLPVAKGGTGATDSASARTALGLGSSATANTGTAAGNIMAIQAGAWYAPASLGTPTVSELYNMNGRSIEIAQYLPVNGSPIPGALSSYGVALALKGAGNEWRNVLQFSTDGDIYLLSITNPSSGGTWRSCKVYTTQNTSRASDGTLRAI